MIGVRGDAVAPLEGVADKAAIWPGAGHRHQKRQIFRVKIVAELLLSNAGLDRDDTQFGLHLDNPVEPGEIDDDTSVARRIGGAVPPITTGADRIEWDRAVAGDFDDGANVIQRRGPQRRGDCALDAGGARAIALLRRCRIEHGRFADANAPCPHRQRQGLGIHGARSTLGYFADLGHAFRVNTVRVAAPGSAYRRRSMLTPRPASALASALFAVRFREHKITGCRPYCPGRLLRRQPRRLIPIRAVPSNASDAGSGTTLAPTGSLSSCFQFPTGAVKPAHPA